MNGEQQDAESVIAGLSRLNDSEWRTTAGRLVRPRNHGHDSVARLNSLACHQFAGFARSLAMTLQKGGKGLIQTDGSVCRHLQPPVASHCIGLHPRSRVLMSFLVQELCCCHTDASSYCRIHKVNPLMGTDNYSATSVQVGTLAVDGWAVTFGTARRGLGGSQPAQSPPRCTKCNSPPINGQCTDHRIAV